MQVTYNGLPLYYWWADVAPGQTRGQGVGNVWWVVPPATVYISHNTELGSVLVGPTGNTLYRFINDEPGVSNCYDQCATNWPPLTVGENDRVAGAAGVEGELGIIDREDGRRQVTYNGMPLYFFAEDEAAGDTNGQGVGDVWAVVAP